MRVTSVSLAILLLVSGCGWVDKFTTVKVDNPVMGPPPPRVAMPDDRVGGTSALAKASVEAEAGSSGRDVLPVNFRGTKPSDGEGTTISQIVATVNGSPIFAADILEPYTKQLAEFQKQPQMSADDLNKAKIALIKKELPGHIQNRLVVSALRKTLTKERMEHLEKHLDELFQERIDEQKRKLGIHSDYELDLKLQNEDRTSISSLRTSFHNRGMSEVYIQHKTESQDEPSRAELLEYYDEHIADYTFPASVKWQQIAVSFHQHGGKQKAFEVFENVVARLKRAKGANFGNMAQEYSDDPKADIGGDWGWTKQGSLANEEIDKVLFELPVGSISAPIVGDDAFRLVKVNDRKPGGRTPFEDVQGEIKKNLADAREKKSMVDVMAELRKDAVITTIFDGEQKTAAALPFE